MWHQDSECGGQTREAISHDMDTRLNDQLKQNTLQTQPFFNTVF